MCSVPFDECSICVCDMWLKLLLKNGDNFLGVDFLVTVRMRTSCDYYFDASRAEGLPAVTFTFVRKCEPSFV